METQKTQFNYLKGFRSQGSITPEALYVTIKGGRFHQDVKLIRGLAAKRDPLYASELKKKMPSVRPAGKRIANHLQPVTYPNYTGVIVLDFDNINAQSYDETFRIISDCKYTLLCFRSLRGNGIKVFIRTTCHIHSIHHLFHDSASSFYERLTGVQIDKGNDPDRLCFLSCDRNAYFNPNSAVYDHFEGIKPQTQSPINSISI